MYDNINEDILNIRQLVKSRVDTMPDKTTFRYMNKKEMVSVSYMDFWNDINALGTYLYNLGLKNTKIGLVGENSYEWILSYFSVICGGNIVVPVDHDLSDAGINEILTEAGVRVLIHSNSYKGVGEKNSDLYCINMSCFTEIIEKGNNDIQKGAREYLDYQIDDDALCSIIYTSGTTGKAKGVMLSQKNLSRNAISCDKVFINDSTLLVLPLHHTFSFICVLAMIHYCVPICINKSLKSFAKDLKIYKPQNMFLVPLFVETIYKNIWANAIKTKKDKALRRIISVSNFFRKIGVDLRHILFKKLIDELGGNLNLIVCGGASVEQKMIDELEDIGILVLNGYGITECSPVVAVNRNNYRRKNSAGLPLACCNVKIIDNEICISGENVMLGYYNDKQLTEESFNGKWFKTGDLGYIDDEGYLYITGRKKNLIILSNGKNVSPEELENKIQELDNELDVVVYAENNLLVAEIYTKNKDDIEEKIKVMNKSLPPYKQIQKVKFRDTEFEKTTTKKIKRNYGG